MNKLLELVKRKPAFFLFLSLAYLFAVGFAKWQIKPPPVALWFVAGGLLGVYFLDAAEVFFALTPSPFRSIVFVGAFMAVSFFIVTSSGSLLASGLVLSLYLVLILWQVGEWQIRGNLNDWYRMVAGPVSGNTQQWIIVAFTLVFLVETFLFVR